MTARRSLLTAAAAGTLLGALWFVPSAGATGGADEPQPGTSATAEVTPDTAGDADGTAGDTTTTGSVPRAYGTYGPPGSRLADSGSVDTTPYLAGGTAFLCAGAGFVAYSLRRGRSTAY